MTTDKVILHIPAREVNSPVICRMSHEHDVTFSILKAEVTEDEDGLMILELTGKRSQVKKAIAYLRESGIGVERLSARTVVSKKKCTHCGACVAHCPTDALTTNEDHVLSFKRSECIACGLCEDVCPFGAIAMSYDELAEAK